MSNRGFDVRTEAICEIIMDLLVGLVESCECGDDKFALVSRHDNMHDAIKSAAEFVEMNCTKVSPLYNEKILEPILYPDED